LGRDRDPFDRTLRALRQRLSQGGPLQGAALPVNGLAAELGVSPTPVREALSRLAGEGLVARNASGYAGAVHDRQTLAELYALAGVLTEALITSPKTTTADTGPDDPDSVDGFDRALGGGNRAIAAALSRVRAQLAPFEAADIALLGSQERQALTEAARQGAPAARLAAMARRYFRRRAKRSGEILAKALGLS